MFQNLNQFVAKSLARASIVLVAGVFGVSILASGLFLATPTTYAAGETWTCSVTDASNATAKTSSSEPKTPPPLIGGTLLPGHGTADDGTLFANLDNIAGKLINTLIGWTAALAVVFIVLGGYQYLTALGEAEAIKKAHKTITWSMLGLALALLSFAIVQVITSVSFGNEKKSSAPISPNAGVWVCESADNTNMNDGSDSTQATKDKVIAELNNVKTQAASVFEGFLASFKRAHLDSSVNQSIQKINDAKDKAEVIRVARQELTGAEQLLAEKKGSFGPDEYKKLQDLMATAKAKLAAIK